MSVDEFLDWFLYDEIEPFGWTIQNVQVARILHLVTSVFTPSNKARPRFADFLLDFMPHEPQTPEEMMAAFAAWDAIAGNPDIAREPTGEDDGSTPD